MIRRLAQPEDDFGNAVAQRAVMVDFGETEVFERQVAHAMQRRIDIGRARCARLRAGRGVDLPSSDKMVASVLTARHVSETPPADARNDQVRALRVRAAVRADRGVAGVSRKRLSTPRHAGGTCSGSSSRWWARARPRWLSTAWSTPKSTRRNPRTKIRHIPAGLLSRGFCWGFTVAASAALSLRRMGTEPALLPSRAARAGRCVRSIRSPSASRIFRTSCWASRWASRPPPRGSRCAARSIRAFSGSPPPSRSGPPASTSSIPARTTSSTATLQLYSVPRLVRHRQGADDRARAARPDDRFAADAGLADALGVLSVAGVAAVACLLIYEHGIVKADDLSRVNAAFFTMNGWVSVLFFVFWAADILLMHQHVITDESHFRRPASRRHPRQSGSGRTPVLRRRPRALPFERSAGARLHGEHRARAHARRCHLFQRQPPYQSDRRLRRQLPAVRVRQAEARSEFLHDVARTGLGDGGQGLERGHHRVPHRRRPASGTESRLVLPDAARPEGALSRRFT